jgi:predicted ester cyclase
VDHEPAHPDQPTGPEGVKQTVRRLHAAFGGLRFEVEDEIADGKIAEHWGSRDDLGLLGQLGLPSFGDEP